MKKYQWHNGTPVFSEEHNRLGTVNGENTILSDEDTLNVEIAKCRYATEEEALSLEPAVEAEVAD